MPTGPKGEKRPRPLRVPRLPACFPLARLADHVFFSEAHLRVAGDRVGDLVGAAGVGTAGGCAATRFASAP
jgi:hypothetical protein